MVDKTEIQAEERTLEQIIHAAAEIIDKHHDEVDQYLIALKKAGIDNEAKLSQTPDAVLLSKKIDISETLLRAIRNIIRHGQLITEFEASDSKGAQVRKEIGPFNKDCAFPLMLVRVFKNKQTCADGKKYEGHWSKDGMRDGYGVMNNGDGTLYEGYWQDNKFHGKGRHIDIDGGVYEGDWIGGHKEGHGVYYYVGGGKYDGQWMCDLKKGYGV